MCIYSYMHDVLSIGFLMYSVVQSIYHKWYKTNIGVFPLWHEWTTILESGGVGKYEGYGEATSPGGAEAKHGERGTASFVRSANHGVGGHNGVRLGVHTTSCCHPRPRVLANSHNSQRRCDQCIRSRGRGCIASGTGIEFMLWTSLLSQFCPSSRNIHH